MATSTFNSSHLADCLERWRAGQLEAANELLSRTGVRLKKLAKRMLRSFPNVRPLAETDDVLQNSTMRLLNSLKTMRPATTRDYFNLAAVHIRRELLDLARKCKSKQWFPFEVPGEPVVETPADFEFWVRFHEAVDKLPLMEREIVGLVFYSGWKQWQIAELFGVDERTVRRRWHNACEHLRQIMSDDRL